jgi:plastocyanin
MGTSSKAEEADGDAVDTDDSDAADTGDGASADSGGGGSADTNGGGDSSGADGGGASGGADGGGDSGGAGGGDSGGAGGGGDAGGEGGTQPATGQEQDGSPQGGKWPPEGLVTVKIKDFKFIPQRVEVPKDGWIMWVNEETKTNHTATKTRGPGYAPSSPNIGWGGDTYTDNFKARGEIEYICTYHPLKMKGFITVK